MLQYVTVCVAVCCSVCCSVRYLGMHAVKACKGVVFLKRRAVRVKGLNVRLPLR